MKSRRSDRSECCRSSEKERAVFSVEVLSCTCGAIEEQAADDEVGLDVFVPPQIATV